MQKSEVNLKNKLSLRSTIFLVVGSCIGAGIFFKTSTVLKYSNQNVPWSIFVWILASLTVITMGFALIEITSKTKDNLSLVSWSKQFNSSFIAKCCKYFFILIYLPLNYFFMPAYVIMSFQDGLEAWGIKQYFGYKHDWLIISALGLVISFWFIGIGISTRAGNISNWIVSTINFIPLIAAIILGLILLSFEGTKNEPISDTRWLATYDQNGHSQFSFFTSSPLIGIFGALAAIFFAFDGFYFTAGVQTEMKEPKKIGKALVVGILIIAAIYFSISFVMTFATKNGEFTGYNQFLQNNNLHWVAGLLNMTIGIGVLSIINGLSIWFPRFLEDLIKAGELWAPKKYRKKLNPSWPKVGTIYEILITLPVVFICNILGGLAYYSDYVSYDAPGFSSVGSYYTFADLMSTWTSVFCFGWIGLILIGGLLNRKTGKVKVQKHRYFVLNASFSVVIILLSVIFSIIQPFADVFINKAGRTWVEAWRDTQLLGNLVLILVLFLFIALSLIPAILETRLEKRRFIALKIKES